MSTARRHPQTRQILFAHRHSRWLIAALMVLLLATNLQTLPASTVYAQTTAQPCIDQGPTGGAYVAHVCFTAPGDTGTYAGDVNTSLTVTATSGALPAVKSVRFYYAKSTSTGRSSLLTDFASPWGLAIPTAHWKDGLYRIEAVVDFADGFSTTTYARIMMTFQNGVTADVRTDGSWTPKTSGASPLNLVAVGDGAGGLQGATDVGNLIKGMNPDLFLYLGDVYNAGTYAEFTNYYEPTLGALKSRTNPVPGNHEGGGDQFKGYLDYWNSNQHYYSFNSGGWHFIALDSTTQFGQTAAGTAQYNWLSQDLQANANTACTLVYFHHPRYGLSVQAGDPDMQDIWSLMALNGVDVVLNGHQHNYQRWKPLNAGGQISTVGMIEFVAGAGGHELMGFGTSDNRVAAQTRTDGALKFSLGATGGSAQYVSTAGTVLDSTSFSCHNGDGTVDPDPLLTFEPVADAMVQQALPDSNSGKINSMRAGTSPQEMSYLRFNVQNAAEPITKATLRLWVRDGTVDAPAIASSSDVTWGETTITWNTKPATGTPGPDLGAVTTGTWIEYDVTSLVRGNGLVTLALIPQSTNVLSVNTRESTTDRPQLVIGGTGGSTVTPPPSPSPTVTVIPSPTPTGTPTEFLAAADARVQEATPTANYGTSTLLRADAPDTGTATTVESYLRFSVTGYSGAPTSAKIRLFVGTGANAQSNNGPALYTAPNGWAEGTITWATRPARGTTALGDLGAVGAGTWVEYDVTSIVTGNGDYSFALATDSTDATDFDSRETANAPRLVLFGGSTTETPTATSTTVPPSPSPTTTATTTTVPASPSPSATTAPGGTTTLNPVADARVEAVNATTNFGTATTLRSDLSPTEETYLRFDVPADPAPITKATLRLWVRDGTSDTDNAPAIVKSSDVTWGETTITWNTKPAYAAPGPNAPNFGAVGLNTWIEYDVTSLVTANGSITLILVPESTNGIVVNSRENATNKPELVITRGASGATPTATATTVPATTAPTVTTATPATVTPTTATPATVAPTQAPSGSTSVPADADAMVQQALPDTNAGTANSMRADSQPMEVSYIRFTVPAGTDPITKATLRLWVRDNTSGTVDAPAVASSSDVTWSETGITWNNRPAVGASGPNFGAIGINTWIEYDVTSLVNGSGPVTLVLVPENNDGMIVNTREAATNKPELVITRGGTTSASATTAQQSLLPAATTSQTSGPTATAQTSLALVPVAATTPASAPTPTPSATVAPSPTATATTATPQTGTVANTGGDGVRLRTAPSPDSEVLAIIPEGATVALRGAPQGDWLPVSYAGQDGYDSAQYVVLNGGATTTPVPATTVTPAATGVPVQPVETAAPTAPPAATPMPVAAGWSSDPAHPWTWLTDGDPATAWTAPAPGEAGLDLGQIVPLGKLRLLPTGPLAGNVEIQLSVDGTTWFHLTGLRLADQTPDTWLQLPAGYQARYVRILLTDPDGVGSVGALAGVEVWAAPDGVAQPLDLLPPVTPAPAPTEAVPATIPATEAPPPTAAPVVQPTAEPTLAPEPSPTPADPGPTPEGSTGGT